MALLVDQYCVRSKFYQGYQWYTNIIQGSTNSIIGNTNCNANVSIGSPNGTIGKSMVPLATNVTIGKIFNGTIGRAQNGAIVHGSTIGNTICTNLSTNGIIGTIGY